MNKKKLAILIPCYNAAATLAETLKSLQKAIENSGMDLPVYLFDDCSTDHSLQIAKSTGNWPGGFTIQKNVYNMGERRTTNLAFAQFNGKYDWVFIMHADDLATTDWINCLATQISKVDDNIYFTVWSSFDAFNSITGTFEKGDDSGAIQDIVRDDAGIRYFLTKVYSNWHISGAALNVKIYNELGGFDERMPQFGDTDFFIRALLRNYRDIYISRTLTHYRISTGSVSSVSFRTGRDVKEIGMLMEKFAGFLNGQDRRKMNGLIRRITGRRLIKSLVNLKLASAGTNFRLFVKASLR